MSEKLSAKQYAEQLLYKPEYAADKQPDVKEKAAAFAEGYKNFLDHAKTEREAAATSEQMLLAAGYKPLSRKRPMHPVRRSTLSRSTRPSWRLPSVRSSLRRASVW